MQLKQAYAYVVQNTATFVRQGSSSDLTFDLSGVTLLFIHTPEMHIKGKHTFVCLMWPKFTLSKLKLTKLYLSRPPKAISG
mgnify:CR=1 FL=1